MTTLNLNEMLQTVMRTNKWHPAKSDGKLTKFNPKKGMTIILEDGEQGIVLRNPNSVGDFTIQLDNGEKVRKNTINSDILGFINNEKP